MSTLMPGHAPLQPHPIANLFPMISDKEIDELGADMRDNGQVETVKLFEGAVLDGRNRYRSGVKFGLPIRTELFSGSQRDALNWVISKNLKRRHLTESQRAMVAARLATLKLGANQHTSQPAQICAPALDLGEQHVDTSPPISQSEAAESLSVSRRSVQTAAEVLEKGSPELVEEVANAGIAVSVAAEIAERPLEEQKAILDALPRDENNKLTPEAKKQVRAIAREVRAEDQAAKKQKRDAKEKALGDKIRALPEEKAGLLISDFEWDFKPYSRESGMDRHASNHYVTAAEARTPEDIVERCRERMTVAADDCVHLAWCPANMVHIALKVIELQGFKYVSQFVWIKPGIGTGFWVRDKHEVLLIAVRGKIPAPNMGEQFESAIEAAKGEHSEKPDFQYEIAERYFPNLPKIELNARRARPGWIQWGNEAPEQPTLGIETEAA